MFSKTKYGVSSAVLDTAVTTLDALAAVAPVIPLPFFQVAVAAAQKVVTIVKTAKANRDDCDDLIQNIVGIIRNIHGALAMKSKDEIPDSLKTSVERLVRDLDHVYTVLAEVDMSTNTKRISNVVKSLLLYSRYQDIVKDCIRKLDWAVKEFQVISLIDLSLGLKRIEDGNRKAGEDHQKLREVNEGFQQAVTLGFDDVRRVAQRIDLTWIKDIPRVSAASCLSPKCPVSSKCLEGTRLTILKELNGWLDDTGSSSPSIFWLNGLAGIGKSTIAYTFSRHAHAKKCLGASFFFSRRGEAGLRDPHLVLPTIASQLAELHPELAPSIGKALREHPHAPENTLVDQLQLMIIEPLQEIQGFSKTLVITFDALDECEDSEEIKSLIHLLANTLPQLPFPLKVFATSRPESSMNVTFKSVKHKEIVLHNIESFIIEKDIYNYLKFELEEIPKKLGLDYPLLWILPKDMEALVNRAGRLFIFAATIARFVGNKKVKNPRQLLQIALKANSVSEKQHPYSDLDELYISLLRNTLDSDPVISEIILERYQITIGTLLLLRDALPISALANLATASLTDVDGKQLVTDALESLQSVILHDEEHVEIYHPSFPDFVKNPMRCKDKSFLIDQNQHESRIAVNCFMIMQKYLKKNLGNNEDISDVSGDIQTLDKLLPAEAQYACKYWAFHITNVEEGPGELSDFMANFVFKQAFWWLETMSLLKAIPLAISSMQLTKEWARKSNSLPKLQNMLSDLHRFAMTHGDIISKSPEQIYLSALPFTPKDTLLYKYYGLETEESLKVVNGIPREWTNLLHTFLGHDAYVKAVAFSPDGSMVASSSNDRTVRIWDTKSGSCIAILLGHEDWIRTVAFSADGLMLASGCNKNTVRLWDLKTYSSVATLKGHLDRVRLVVFSPVDPLLASCSNDSTIRLWDTKSAICIALLKDHSHYINFVSFSSNGSTLASGSTDHTAKLWDIKSRSLIATMSGHTDGINQVAFSPDDSILATSSYDYTIRLWNAKNGAPIGQLREHSDWVNSIAFSPDGSTLGSCSNDCTARLWNVKTGTSIATMHGHSNHVKTFAFSSDGATVASGSNDNTIRLWDAKSGNPITILEGHSNWVKSIVFSPDGSTLVSCSRDHTVRLWDTKFDTSNVNFEGHSQMVKFVVFSSDGTTFATCSDDHTVRLWDTRSGNFTAILKGHSDFLASAAFSPDGLILATCSNDHSVRLWTAKTGASINILNGHTDWIKSVLFSPDGSLLVSCSNDHTVKLWDVKTGICIATLEGHSDWMKSAAFSPDSSILASCSNDHTIRIWDVKTKTSVNIIYAHSDWIIAAAFSANGKIFASCSNDHTVKIWDVELGYSNVRIMQIDFFPKSLHFTSDGLALQCIGFNGMASWLISEKNNYEEVTDQDVAADIVSGARPGMWLNDEKRKLFLGYSLDSAKLLAVLPTFIDPEAWDYYWPYVAIGCKNGQVLELNAEKIVDSFL